jgi:hypothetical protein
MADKAENEESTIDLYTIRFIGRFLFAYTGTRESPSVVTPLAIDMAFNPDLAVPLHRLLVVVPRMNTQTLGTKPAELTLFGPTPGADEEAQLLVWDVGGYDVYPRITKGGGITLVDWEDVPDVGEFTRAAGGKARFSGPPDRATLSRFTLTAGQFRAIQFDPNKKVTFEPFGQDGPRDTPHKPLPDVVDVELELNGPLYLDLERRSDGSRSSIGITPSRRPRERLVITVSNLCPRPGSTFDREFAALYEIFDNPPPLRERLIPYESEAPEEGRHADCTSFAAVNTGP